MGLYAPSNLHFFPATATAAAAAAAGVGSGSVVDRAKWYTEGAKWGKRRYYIYRAGLL